MKVYGDGGGMFAQVFGKSEQPIYQPREQQPQQEAVTFHEVQIKEAKKARCYRERVAEKLKDPNSKYHGTIMSTQVPKEKRCHCPKCQAAQEEVLMKLKEKRKRYNESIRKRKQHEV